MNLILYRFEASKSVGIVDYFKGFQTKKMLKLNQNFISR